MADTTAAREAFRIRAREIVETAVESVLEATVADAPLGTSPGGDHGQLRDRGNYEVDTWDAGDVIGAEITCTPDAAEYTEKGTRPHVILPVKGTVLAFEVEGEMMFARRVFHPGTEAQNWFAEPMAGRWTDALERAADR